MFAEKFSLPWHFRSGNTKSYFARYYSIRPSSQVRFMLEQKNEQPIHPLARIFPRQMWFSHSRWFFLCWVAYRPPLANTFNWNYKSLWITQFLRQRSLNFPLGDCSQIHICPTRIPPHTQVVGLASDRDLFTFRSHWFCIGKLILAKESPQGEQGSDWWSKKGTPQPIKRFQSLHTVNNRLNFETKITIKIKKSRTRCVKCIGILKSKTQTVWISIFAILEPIFQNFKTSNFLFSRNNSKTLLEVLDIFKILKTWRVSCENRSWWLTFL